MPIYRAGLAHLNAITGWQRRSAARGCPPPAGSGTGRGIWHTRLNPRYRASRPDQIVECYSEAHLTGALLYLWTLPAQRVILVAGDRSPGTSYPVLEHWWEGTAYG